MDPISNIDRLVLLLRQRLIERSRTAGGQAARRAAPGPRGAEAVQALAALEGMDDRKLRRALIQNILSEQLGGGLINEAKFQQVVDRVTEALEGDPAVAGLLNRVVADLRASA